MSINSAIGTALAPLAVPIEPIDYTGIAETYITFDYSTSGDDFADNAPQYERYLVQVHYVCPAGVNSLATRLLIKQYLLAAGFTWPAMTDASDADRQHFVFEAEYLEAVDTGG